MQSRGFSSTRSRRLGLLHHDRGVKSNASSLRGVQNHDELAKKLATGRRHLFRLIGQFKAAQTNDSLSFRHGSYSILDTPVLAILDQAIAELGENADPNDVHAATKIRCEEAGVAVPSVDAIAGRMSAAPEHPNLIHRFGYHADLVIDHCQLDLWVAGPDSETLPVYLIGLIGMSTGAVLAYSLKTHLPNAFDALALLRRNGNQINRVECPGYSSRRLI
jgi:hypothetical protein